MNRKLHNIAYSLIVSGTLLVLGLMVQIPDGAPDRTHAPVAVAVASAALVAEQPSASGRSGRAGRSRHSVAMPFFSFAPRG